MLSLSISLWIQIALIEPIRKEIIRLESDPVYLDQILASGADAANRKANETITLVKKTVGLI